MIGSSMQDEPNIFDYQGRIMKKRILLLSLFATLASLHAHAGTSNPYVGGSLSIQNITAAPSAYRGLRPGMFVGYGSMIDNDYYVAGELAASMVATITDTYVNRDDSLRQAPNFSLSVIPGMMLTRATLAFIRAGVAVGMFSVSDDWRPGLVLGLGIEAAWTPCWSVRVEYDNTTYRSVSVGTPRSDEFGVSFKYIFDA
jgi:opacity protein-like surface antigen